MPSIDTSGLRNPQVVDIAGALQKGNTALQSEIKTREMQQEAGDQQVIRDLSSVPGVDFSTPKGIKEFMGHLQGRVSPDTIMKLGDMSNRMEQAENQKILNLAKMAKDDRDRYESTQEMVMSAFDGMDKIESPEERTSKINERLTGLKGEKTSGGTNLYDPRAIEALQAMPWDRQQSIYKGSQHAKDLLARAKDEAQVKRLEELTRASKEGTAENWATKEGKPLLRHKDGTFYEVNPETGEQTKLAAMPEGAYNVSKAKAGGLSADEHSQLSPEANAWIAEYQQVTGKQIPGIPAGSGAAARKARLAYMESFYKLGKERGYTGGEAGELALTRDATRESMKSIITKNANIAASEKDLAKVATVIKDELTKLGGPDSPLVRKYWNKASTDWLGDPQFSALNTAITNYTEVAAKTLSNQTGAGGTPVSYLHLAQQTLGTNPTLEQFSKIDDVMNKLFKAREDSNRETLNELRASSRMVDKTGGAGAEKPSGESSPSKDPKAAEKSSDALLILESERERADKKLAEIKADPKAKPEDVTRAENDLAGVRREIARLKGGKAEEPKKGPPKEGDTDKSKSGKPIVFRNGKWEYQ